MRTNCRTRCGLSRLFRVIPIKGSHLLIQLLDLAAIRYSRAAPKWWSPGGPLTRRLQVKHDPRRTCPEGLCPSKLSSKHPVFTSLLIRLSSTPGQSRASDAASTVKRLSCSNGVQGHRLTAETSGTPEGSPLPTSAAIKGSYYSKYQPKVKLRSYSHKNLCYQNLG